jgi:hypothetical protein
MDLIWILTGLTGGGYDGHAGAIKYYNAIEYDNLDNTIKISEFYKSLYRICPEKTDDSILPIINKELDKGKKFLCKTDIYYNGNRLFEFGYYSKKNGEYKYTTFSNTKNKIIYKKLVALLIDNCMLDLP